MSSTPVVANLCAYPDCPTATHGITVLCPHHRHTVTFDVRAVAEGTWAVYGRESGQFRDALAQVTIAAQRYRDRTNEA